MTEQTKDGSKSKSIRCKLGFHGSWKHQDEHRRECERCERKEQEYEMFDAFMGEDFGFVGVKKFFEWDYNKGYPHLETSLNKREWSTQGELLL